MTQRLYRFELRTSNGYRDDDHRLPTGLPPASSPNTATATLIPIAAAFDQLVHDHDPGYYPRVIAVPDDGSETLTLVNNGHQCPGDPDRWRWEELDVDFAGSPDAPQIDDRDDIGTDVY